VIHAFPFTFSLYSNVREISRRLETTEQFVSSLEKKYLEEQPVCHFSFTIGEKYEMTRRRLSLFSLSFKLTTSNQDKVDGE